MSEFTKGKHLFGLEVYVREAEAVRAALSAAESERDSLRAEVETVKEEVEECRRCCLQMQEALSPLVPQPPEGYGAAELAHAVANAFRSMDARLCDGNATDAENALVGIRMSLDDLGIRAHQTPEGTRSAVELLCVKLRQRALVWSGEELVGVTCPSEMQREDNAALRQRVLTALGERLVRDLEAPSTVGLGFLYGVGEALAQFDLLGRDL